ncbi:MAG: hydroxymethylbilane synthase [Chloroflexi bacterium]|nr:hydroxymethylbilane synthase [Chloroflexota bacterium]
MAAPTIEGLKQVIRIGARRSKLSRWQAKHIADLLKGLEPAVRIEIREYSTRGDTNPNAPLPTLGGKGLFTEALEEALRRGEIDCAVHSLKDMPVDIAKDLALVAVPKRGDHRDALVSRSGAALAELPPGARIGTGSLRRSAQLLAIRPDLDITPIRGNVPTRLAKLRNPDEGLDAVVLAVAGLQRLGLEEHISEIFDASQMLSAAGQGALAVQCLYEGDPLVFFGRLTDRVTEHATAAERAFVGALDVGCALPVAAYAHIRGSAIHLSGRVLSEDGKQRIDVSGEGQAFDGAAGRTFALQLGRRLAQQALEQGADRILQRISSKLNPPDEG